MEVILSKTSCPFKMTSVEMRFRCFVTDERLQPHTMTQISRALGDHSCHIKEAHLKYQNKEMTLNEFRDVFITEICGAYSVHDILKTLLFSNNLHSIGMKLFWCFYDSKPGRRTVNVPRLRTRLSKSTTSYFVFLKNAVHARKFSKPYEQVKRIANQYLVKLNGQEMEDRELQKASDMYVALKAIEYDACSNINETASEDEERFTDMETKLDQTSCPIISRVLLYGRKADAFSNFKLFEDGEQMLIEAYVCADLSHSCLEIVDMIYKGVVFKLSHFEQNTTKELQEEILFDAHRALTLLSQEYEDDQKFWKVLLLLRMAYALLGIGKHCRIIQNYHPSVNNLIQANGILNSIDCNNLDHRKEMFYKVAKARYCQYTNRKEWCIYYLTEAMKLALIGGYATSSYIEEYGRAINLDLAYLYDLQLADDSGPVLMNPLDAVTGERVYLNILPHEVSDNPVTHVFPDNLVIPDEETEDEDTVTNEDTVANEEQDNTSTESTESSSSTQNISLQNPTDVSLEQSSNSSTGLTSFSPLTLSSLDDDMSL